MRTRIGKKNWTTGVMAALLRRFVRDDHGLETVEYAIITGLIVAGVVTVLAAVGTWVLNTYQDAQTAIGA